MQDLERMRAMMRSGITDASEFRSGGEDFGAAVSAAGETMGEGVANRKRKRVTKKQRAFNEQVGAMSGDLTRRRNRGSGM